MTNVCVLWNTVYTARALEQIRAEGHAPDPVTQDTKLADTASGREQQPTGQRRQRARSG